MKTRRYTFSAALLIGVTVIGTSSLSSNQLPHTDTVNLKKSIASSLPKVSVTKANVGNFHPNIIGFGEAKAANELLFTSEINGRVISLSESFKTGKILPKGTVIAQLDDTNHKQLLAKARANLIQLELELLEEERRSKQALSEWKRSGVANKPASELVLRSPQLALAKANLASAKIDIVKAQRDLNNTVIRLPFDALIVTRDIQLGSVLQMGSQVATLYSTNKVEIRVPLSEAQWSNMPRQRNAFSNKHKVKLTNAAGDRSWEGTIERAEKHLSSETRQRAIIVSVSNPFHKNIGLYPGTFVKAKIEGKSIENLWEVPSSAISQNGDIWFVDSNKSLRKAKAKRRFDVNEKTYVLPITSDQSLTKYIVKRPLSHLEEGMLVQVTGERSDAE
ncbi:efflux RND transporter periplasmic adaptor subunit [Alteromonas sp. 5E99-2]|uniref:efflux RND transporter periplasmic adaptor subunit n=1 Tax=Alteromonas sp. 5E99-2 TaxID=2817683 RepID=UPI001A9A1B9B|nr:efflux RND transporter periplasmic adaptor subunit [Alteromonas sp. 5E99-2]MBO1256677.1 efflux RND transporter periplasmic adaptor subunit [Alteromonas sp. 5E99-2]